jgi:hypothetical protein
MVLDGRIGKLPPTQSCAATNKSSRNGVEDSDPFVRLQTPTLPER